MRTVWGDGRGPAGLPDAGSVCGEPVHQGAAGTRHTAKQSLCSWFLCYWFSIKHEISDAELKQWYLA